MSNIKFQYLYRDGSNYKKWGDVVFSNPDGLPLADVSSGLQRLFLTDGLFIAHQIRVPELFLSEEYGLDVGDHCYHEFHAADVTSDPPSDRYVRSIRQFLNEVRNESQVGWKIFDPLDRLTIGRL